MENEELNLIEDKEKQGRIPKEDIRYHTFLLVLYKDSKLYDYYEVINNIIGWCKHYAFIEHEPEKKERKVHTHVIMYFDNSKYVETIENQLGVSRNYIQVPLSFRGSCRYLTHIDYPEKIQYTLEEVNVSKSFLRRFFQAYDDEKLDDEVLQDILQYIEDNADNYSRIELIKNLMIYVTRARYKTIYKQFYTDIHNIINEYY